MKNMILIIFSLMFLFVAWVVYDFRTATWTRVEPENGPPKPLNIDLYKKGVSFNHNSFGSEGTKKGLASMVIESKSSGRWSYVLKDIAEYAWQKEIDYIMYLKTFDNTIYYFDINTHALREISEEDFDKTGLTWYPIFISDA